MEPLLRSIVGWTATWSGDPWVVASGSRRWQGAA